ncbi:MAG: dTMP kinase [Candidatus Omnitrophica bacterium]|nr:dTMP kinase [Candidatus Omnitrophota bacterium]
MKGVLITFEGPEGSGKSTQIEMARQYLSKPGRPVILTREPGGVKVSERIRDILLDVKSAEMTNECEMLLYMAARSQLVKEVIAPALDAGKIILCDRYLDSTLAYQGYGHGLDLDLIRRLGRFATQGIVPDLTLVFDLDTAEGLQRIRREKDRIELRSLAYHQRVRQGYRKIAADESARVKLIPVEESKERVHEIVRGYIDQALKL